MNSDDENDFGPSRQRDFFDLLTRNYDADIDLSAEFPSFDFSHLDVPIPERIEIDPFEDFYPDEATINDPATWYTLEAAMAADASQPILIDDATGQLNEFYEFIDQRNFDPTPNNEVQAHEEFEEDEMDTFSDVNNPY